MSTGNVQQPKVKRTIVLEPLLGDDGRIVKQRAEAEEAILDLLGSLWTVGGILRIVADRVKIGDLPGTETSSPEPLGETVGLIIEYQANTALNKASVTAALMDSVHEGNEPASPAPAAAAETPAVSEEDDHGDDGSGVPVTED
jgi:hypothetical protein